MDYTDIIREDRRSQSLAIEREGSVPMEVEDDAMGAVHEILDSTASVGALADVLTAAGRGTAQGIPFVPQPARTAPSLQPRVSTEYNARLFEAASSGQDVELTGNEAIYQLYVDFASMIDGTPPHGFFVAVSGEFAPSAIPQASPQVDTAADDAARFHAAMSLSERTQAAEERIRRLVAEDEAAERGEFLPSRGIEAASREEVISGLLDGTIILKSDATMALDTAAGKIAELIKRTARSVKVKNARKLPDKIGFWKHLFARHHELRIPFVGVATSLLQANRGRDVRVVTGRTTGSINTDMYRLNLESFIIPRTFKFIVREALRAGRTVARRSMNPVAI